VYLALHTRTCVHKCDPGLYVKSSQIDERLLKAFDSSHGIAFAERESALASRIGHEAGETPASSTPASSRAIGRTPEPALRFYELAVAYA